MFKYIVLDFKEFSIWLLKWLFYRRQAIKMNLAIRLADIKQKAFNKRFHVMIMEINSYEKLVSVSRDDIIKLKRKKWLPKNVSMESLRDSIFYSTPLSRNNTSTWEDRQKSKEKYFKYLKKYRRTKF